MKHRSNTSRSRTGAALLAAALATTVAGAGLAAGMSGAFANGSATVMRAYTDKSSYEPGKKAIVTAEASGSGTVHFSLSHLGTEVASYDAPVNNGIATWELTPPSTNYRGYLVSVTGANTSHAETAIDVSKDWKRFPRMGFLSHFKPLPPTDKSQIKNGNYGPYLFFNPEDYINKLSQDYHINALQYYDWMYRHEKPVATGDLAEQWPIWWENNHASAQTIRRYISQAKNQNMASLAYSMSYAAMDNFDTSVIKDEWRLRNADGSYAQSDLGTQWWLPGKHKPANHLNIMNVNDAQWRGYITSQYVEQIHTFDFTGTHIDQLDSSGKFDASGKAVDLTSGFAALVNETAAATGRPVGINLPDGSGKEDIADAKSDYMYTELWDHTDTNAQVAEYLQSARDAAGNKPQVVAAYMNNYDSTVSRQTRITPEIRKIEAESDQGSVKGRAEVLSGDASASNGAYVADHGYGGSGITFTFTVDHPGTYSLTPRYAREGTSQEQNRMIVLDGKLIEYADFGSTGSYYSWADGPALTIELDKAGTHTLSYEIGDGLKFDPVNIDYLAFKEFNTASVQLADAMFAANGAHHLELGDYGRMLDNEYFVSSGRAMDSELSTWMKNYYNITTAYENIIYGDNLTRQERQVEVSTAGVGLPTSTNGAANTVWANTMKSDAGTALHLINLRTNTPEGNDEYWRNTATDILQFNDVSVTYHLTEGDAIPSAVHVVSPDRDGGIATRVPFTLGTNEAGYTTVTFNVGSLKAWDMVILTPSDRIQEMTAYDRMHTPSTGQIVNDLGQCLDDQDGFMEDGTVIWNQECLNGPSLAQDFTYQDHHLYIRGKCLDVLEQRTDDGAPVHLWQCYSSLPSQTWDRTESGQYVNRASGTCLTIPGDTTTTSTRAVIAQCSDSSPSQRWSRPGEKK